MPPAPPFTLSPDTQGRLTLKREGHEDAPDVRIRRAFPWSNPDRHLSLRSKDGKELLQIDDLGQLPADLQSQIRTVLSASTLIPKITRVLTLAAGFGHHEWSVETDRGPIAFRMQEKEDLRFLPDGRFTVKDADGNLYEIPRIADLDPRSAKLLEALT